MTTLEKILQEIEHHAIEFEAFGFCDDYISVGWIKDIIKKHLSCENETTRQSRDNDGWIPTEKEIPKENGRYLVQFKETGDEIFLIGYGFCRMDVLGKPNKIGWYDTHDAIYFDENAIKCWQPLPKPYKPPVESADSKRMREREEFFKDGE